MWEQIGIMVATALVSSVSTWLLKARMDNRRAEQEIDAIELKARIEEAKLREELLQNIRALHGELLEIEKANGDQTRQIHVLSERVLWMETNCKCP